MSCVRCGGLLVNEFIVDPIEGSHSGFHGQRCLNCGTIVWSAPGALFDAGLSCVLSFSIPTAVPPRRLYTQTRQEPTLGCGTLRWSLANLEISGGLSHRRKTWGPTPGKSDSIHGLSRIVLPLYTFYSAIPPSATRVITVSACLDRLLLVSLFDSTISLMRLTTGRRICWL